MTVTRALVPCGGRGTRMMGLTGGAPKELIDIGGVPVVVRVLEECAASGIEEVLVVISPEKNAVVDLLAPLSGRERMPASISFAVQQEPRGLADAIRLGRGFAGTGPMGVALPDNLFAGAAPGLKQVIDTHVATGKNVVAVVEITAAEASRRGPTSVYPGRISGDEFVIDRIPGKGERGKTFDTGGAASAFTGVGRFVFTPDAFDAIDFVEETLSAGAELDDVPVMQRLLEGGRLTGRRIVGRFFDVGLPGGYDEAKTEYSGAASSG
ncbi:MAG TPA: sugar phosphate nucleotidyltransferase [Gemmatimonadaceae bacterium]|nr:sugar phosphate nucleotidyltransferase [Gemmatimonadaceae bacterium]